VSPRTSPTAAAPSTSSISAELARLGSVTGSCVGGCATSEGARRNPPTVRVAWRITLSARAVARPVG
jgi:hypothetical protein